MKIKKISYGPEGIEVHIEGYDGFIPCFAIEDIADSEDLLMKLKLKLVEIDNAPEPPPSKEIPQKFLDIKEYLEGKEI